MDFDWNSGLVCQTGRLEDILQSELEGLRKRYIDKALFDKRE